LPAAFGFLDDPAGFLLHDRAASSDDGSDRLQVSLMDDRRAERAGRRSAPPLGKALRANSWKTRPTPTTPAAEGV
jgi:hypothetical protein